MTYRIVHKICFNRNEAEEVLQRVYKKVENAFIERSPSYSGWLVCLLEDNDKELIDNGIKYYQQLQIPCFIQIKV